MKHVWLTNNKNRKKNVNLALMQHLRGGLAPPCLPITNQLRDHPSPIMWRFGLD